MTSHWNRKRTNCVFSNFEKVLSNKVCHEWFLLYRTEVIMYVRRIIHLLYWKVVRTTKIMSFLPPNYSSVSICDPPEYSDIVSNLPSSSPPPYVNSTDSSTVNLPSHLESSPTPEEVYEDSQCVESCWTFSWILFLIILGLLHLVLSGIYFQCPIPETDLNGIRTLLFLHIIFSVVMIIYFRPELTY
jgi:hypothetical protein